MTMEVAAPATSFSTPRQNRSREKEDSDQVDQFQEVGGAIDKDPFSLQYYLNCSAVSPFLVGQNEWPMDHLVQGDGGCNPVMSVVAMPRFI